MAARQVTRGVATRKQLEHDSVRSLPRVFNAIAPAARSARFGSSLQ